MLVLLICLTFLYAQGFFIFVHMTINVWMRNCVFQKKILSNYPVYDHCRGFILSYYRNLRVKHEKIILRLLCCLWKKILDDIIFDILPLKTYCHLFYCNRGFDVVNKCYFCTRFYVPSSVRSCDLVKKFTFHLDFFKVTASNVYLERITLFFHYNGIYFSQKDNQLEGNYQNMGVFF